MKVSVIVPVCNVRDYLPQCVESILTQSFQNFELLLVDDNSTDGSEQLCDQYAQADPRVRVLHLTEHRGISVARNTGVKNARGDLISFIDSDDFVSEEYLAQMVATLTAYQADVVFTEYNELDQQAGIFYFNVVSAAKGEVYELTAQSAAAMPDERLPFRHGCYVHPWGKLAKRELYLQHPFIPDLYFEDGPNSLRIFLATHKVVGLLRDDYTYRIKCPHAITQGTKILKGNMDLLQAFRFRALDMLAAGVDPTSFRAELLHNLQTDAGKLEATNQTDCEEYREIQWLLKLMTQAQVAGH